MFHLVPFVSSNRKNYLYGVRYDAELLFGNTPYIIIMGLEISDKIDLLDLFEI